MPESPRIPFRENTEQNSFSLVIEGMAVATSTLCLTRQLPEKVVPQFRAAASIPESGGR